MAKRGQYKERSGYQRIAGSSRRYRDLTTGEVLSRRQYLKKTEGISSLESKAKKLKKERLERGERQPMRRYDAIVAQYRLTHPGVKVRGDSEEALEFKRQYEIFTRSTRGKPKRERIRHLRAGVKLGFVEEHDFDRYVQQGGD